MKKYLSIVSLVWFSLLATNCQQSNSHSHSHDEAHEEHDHHNHDEGHAEEISLNENQFRALNIQIDSLQKQNLQSYVEANGQLEVPPQNQAAVTSIIGANVSSIEVIEGDEVKKGQVLAYLSHPALIQLQSEYLQSWHQLRFQEAEIERQEKLFKEKVSSGKEYQKAQANYAALKSKVLGLEAQVKLLGLDLKVLQEGKIYEKVAVKSPINGFIQLVEIKTGQYVQAQKELFEIVNIDHIHADLMVFEKDINKVAQGQKVWLRVGTEGKDAPALAGKIYSVGKSFEQNPKAVHIHASIENKEGKLLPGLYVRGRIVSEEATGFALPEEAVVQEDEQYYIFSAEAHQHHDEKEWLFKPIAVKTGARSEGWVEIIPLEEIAPGQVFAWNQAYYLMAELKKGEAEHSH